jgi:hypothetical protein
VVRGHAILALVAEPSAQDIAPKFAAKLLTAPFADAFGFQLAKLAKFAAHDIDAKPFASKFLPALLVGFASQPAKLLTTA